MQSDEGKSFEGKIAIIGMACRLPGAKNIYEYWKNLLDGVETLSTFSDEELLAAGVDPSVFRQPNYIRNRGIIDGAEIMISDTGVGIPRKNLESIFRMENNKSRLGTANERGSGLGLILCKEFIEKHGGKIQVESHVDKGSVFSITLPGLNR
ncbi:MAG: ATP-binding protein [Bacteroidales bacterium]